MPRGDRPGSHCKVAKPAHTGANWGSGVVDEYFLYVASQYTSGGRCTVTSTKRDTLIAAYATCGRFGAQAPLGFANSENGRQASISFPCEAGTSYYLFWNAEYMPGRFSFTISEACGAGCVKAHRSRHLLRLRHKQRSATERDAMGHVRGVAASDIISVGESMRCAARLSVCCGRGCACMMSQTAVRRVF